MAASKPTYVAMVTDAVLNIRDYTKGASRQAIAKFIKGKYDADSAVHLRQALSKLEGAGTLLRSGVRYKFDASTRKGIRKEQTQKKKGSKKKKKTTKKKATKKKATKKKTTKKKTTKKKTTKKKTTTKKKATKKKTTTKKTAAAPAKRAKRAKAGLIRQDTVHVYAGHPETEPEEEPKKKATKKKATKKKATKKKTTKKKTTKKKTTKKKTTKKKTTKKKATKKTATKKKASTKKAAPKRKASEKKAKTAPAKKSKATKAAVEVEEKAPPSLTRQASSFSPIVQGAELYKDADGVVYEANLAQINLATNTDKFYKIQILSSGGSYYCGQRWGRTGNEGQTSTSGPFSTVEEAIVLFEKKFKEKAGAPWAQRDTYVAKENKYRFKKKDYDFVQQGKVMWQYYVDDYVDGKRTDWYDYFESASENVEGVFQEWKNNRTWLDIRCVSSGHWTYRVDFNKYEQENNSTHKKRKIRRTVDGKPSEK